MKTTHIRALLILCYLLAWSSSFGQSGTIAFTEYDLDNGLHVILHQDHGTPIVAVGMMYHVGSKNEDPERTGFAHFFEHLLFEGSKNIKRGEFDKYVTNAGGYNNANTSNDRTYYYELLPSNQLELGLWLESERMLHAEIAPIGVETQREVVKEEKRQRVDNRPYGSIVSEIMKRAYTVHPYRWTTIGSLEHLNAATLEEFIEFYETFYVPENATLTIAGDLDIEKTKAMIDRYFSTIPKGSRPVPRPTVVEPASTTEVRDTIYDNIQLPAVIQAYAMPAQGTPDAYALDMLGTLLSGGNSSRMYKAIVDKDQKALQVAALPFSLEDPGLYIVYGIANVGIEAAELEKSIDREIHRVQQDTVPEREFQKIRNQVENRFVDRNSTMEGVAESLANYHVYFGDTHLINTEIERYLKVSREDLQRVAGKYLTEENRVVLHYLPKSAEQ